MKKLYYFMSVAAIALGLASCNKAEIDSAKGPLTIIANTESGVDTKTSLSGDDATGYQVLWSEGDEISTSEGYKFILTEGAGTTRGTFVAEDEIEDGPYYIFYATNGRYLTNVSKYKNSCTITSAPMKAEATIENGVVTSVTEFKNMCGLLRLTLKGSGTVKEVKVIDNDEPLYGRIDNYRDDPVSVEYTSDVGDHALIQDCGEGVELSDEGVDFYFPVPPGDYHAIRIEITDFSGHTVIKTLKSTSKLNIARAMITPVSLNVTGLTDKGILPGRFFVGTTKLVYFTKGNLYWDGDSFEFEENQYDCLPGWSSTHVDHFSWNKDAAEAYARISSGGTLSSDVLFTNDPDHEQYPNKDFTVGGVKGKYRTLTQKEWEYLFKNNPHKWTKVHDVNGLVIAPIEHRGTLLDSYADNDALAAENLVFLPAAGSYPNNNGESPGLFNTYCYYWSSSAFSDGSGYLTRCDAQYLFSDVHYLSTNKYSIRLVKDE